VESKRDRETQSVKRDRDETRKQGNSKRERRSKKECGCETMCERKGPRTTGLTKNIEGDRERERKRDRTLSESKSERKLIKWCIITNQRFTNRNHDLHSQGSDKLK